MTTIKRLAWFSLPASAPVVFALVVFALTAASCGPRTVERYDWVGTQTTVFVDEAVESGGGPQVLVRPLDEPMRMPAAVVTPFRILQNMEERKHLGLELGRMFWAQWVERQVFTQCEYYQNGPWEGPGHAVAIGRAMGADLVVTGDVTRLFMGGTAGASELAMHLYVYETSTGKLIWNMIQSARIQNHPDQDFIFYRETSRMPMEPMAVLMQTIARDMAAPVHAWLAELRQEENQARTAGGAL